MCFRSLILATLCGAVLAGQERRSAQDSELLGLARRFIKAYRADDEDAMAHQTAGGGIDLVLVADALFAIHAARTTTDGGQPDDTLKALQRFAELSSRLPHHRGRPLMVRTWSALGRPALEHEASLRRVARDVSLAREAGAAPDRVLELTQEALESLERLPPSVPAFSILTSRASALLALGRYADVLEVLGRAQAIARGLHWPSAELYCAHWSAEASCRLRRFVEAERIYAETITLAMAASMGRRRAEAHIGRAIVRNDRGDSKGAAQDCDDAWRILSSIEFDPEGLLARLAHASVDAGRHDLAAAAARAGLRIVEHPGGPSYQGDCLSVLAMIEIGRGRTDLALASLDKLKALQNSRDDATTLGTAGAAYLLLRRPEQAIEVLTRALSLVQDPDPNDHTSRCLSNLGHAHLQLLQYDQALIFYGRARQRLLEFGNQSRAAVVLADMGSVHLARNEMALGRASLETALAEMVPHGSPIHVAWTRATLGFALAHDGEAERGRELLTQAAREQERVGAWNQLSETLATLAGVARDLGRHDEARELVRDALNRRLELDQGFGEDDALPLRAQHRDLAGLGIAAVLADAAPQGDRSSRAEDAWWFLEAGRGLLLSEQITNRRALFCAALPSDLIEDLDRAWWRVQSLRAIFVQHVMARADAAQLRRERDALEAAHDKYRAARAQAGRVARRVETLVRPKPAALPDLQRCLAVDAALILYHLPERSENAAAVVVTRSSVHVQPLGPVSEILDASEAWLDMLAAGSHDESRVAASLFDALLRPLEAICGKKRRLLISPEGILASLPFDAFVRREGEERGTRAVERWEISYVASGTVYEALVRQRGTPGRGLLVLADPIYGKVQGAPIAAGSRSLDDLPPLPGSAEEARAIAALFPANERTILLGAKATTSELVRSRAQADHRLAALHLACHGNVDLRATFLTGLVLSNREILSVDDIYSLEMDSDLVVLSACDSGRGRMARGEGAISLVRAFHYAGCPTVIAAQWKIEDRIARDFMVTFYEAVRRKELRPAAALRLAKLQMLRSESPRAHPKAWAPFVLWGLPD